MYTWTSTNCLYLHLMLVMPDQKSIWKAIKLQYGHHGQVFTDNGGFVYISYKQLPVYNGQNASPMETGLQLLL